MKPFSPAVLQNLRPAILARYEDIDRTLDNFRNETGVSDVVTNIDHSLALHRAGSTHVMSGRGGDTHEALLDLLEPGSARRYQDVYLMIECDLSQCLYIATSNSSDLLSEPLLSRPRPYSFQPPGPSIRT